MEQWNNVELTNLSKKSYTLNHSFDFPSKKQATETSNNTNSNNNDNDNNNGTEIATAQGNESKTLKPGSEIRPKINLEDVEALAQRLYGISTASISELISYDDRNYIIKDDPNVKNPIIVTRWPHGYVLKILNSLDSQKTDFVDAQNHLMIYLAKQGIQCPKPIENVNGKYYSLETLNGKSHVVRLLEFIPGKMFHQVELTNYLLFQSGEYLAKIDNALRNFKHDAYETHKSHWMLQSVPKLKDFVHVLTDHVRKELVEEVMDAFETKVLSHLEKFEMQIIHGDYNEQNIIVEPTKSNTGYRVNGIIDFGDTSKSPILFEVGIAMTYMMIQAKNLESGGIFLAGYTSLRSLNAREKELLKYCVAARLAQSLVMGAYTHSLDSSNEYVLVTQQEGWKLLEKLWRENLNDIDELWQNTGDNYLKQSVK